MTQYRTYEEDWDHEEDTSSNWAICGSKIDKERLRKAHRKKKVDLVYMWLSFTIFLGRIIDSER